MENCPELEKYELHNRRQKEYLIDDIYELGKCIHSRLDVNQAKVLLALRSETVNDAAVQNEKVLNDADNSDVSALSPVICKSFRKAKSCVEGCKYRGKHTQKQEDIVQCHICQHWIHPSCAGEDNKDIVGIWSCPSCRSSPDMVHKIFTMMTTMQHENIQFKTLLSANLAEMDKKQAQTDQQIKNLNVALTAKSNELSTALKEISNLRSAISELTIKLEQQSWKNFRSQNADKKTLVVGSSIIRDMSESQLVNTDIVCIPGGSISDVTEVISEKPANKYGRVVLVVGGNNCKTNDINKEQNASTIVDQYKSLVNLCKQKATSVTVSSVCPRIVSADVRTKIDLVNTGLQVMCEDEDVKFVDNSTSFYLKDGSINDAYYLEDGVHLTYKATNKLAQNLELNLKAGMKNVYAMHRQKRSRKSAQSHSASIPADNASPEDEYEAFSHPFWQHAQKKAYHKRHQERSGDQSVSLKHTQQFKEPTYKPRNETRCYRCYEKNHTMRNCRHEQPIICNTCGAEGHKSKHHTA